MAEANNQGPDWPEVVAFALQQGQSSLAERAETRRWLKKEAGTTLALYLTGVGGTLAYAAPLFNGQGGGPLVWAAAVACCYLALLSAALVLCCLWAQPVAAQFNDPEILLAPPHEGLMHLHWGEARSLQVRIERMRRDVDTLAQRLNWLRLAGAALPLVAAAGSRLPGMG